MDRDAESARRRPRWALPTIISVGTNLLLLGAVARLLSPPQAPPERSFAVELEGMKPPSREIMQALRPKVEPKPSFLSRILRPSPPKPSPATPQDRRTPPPANPFVRRPVTPSNPMQPPRQTTPGRTPAAESRQPVVPSNPYPTRSEPGPSGSGGSGGTEATGPGVASGSGNGSGNIAVGGGGNGDPSGSGGGTGSGHGQSQGHGDGDHSAPPPPPVHEDPPPKPRPEPEPPKPRGETRPARINSQSRPAYPQDARDDGVEGTSVLLVTLDGEGRVRSVRVDKSAGDKRLDRAAERAVREWSFSPALKDGEGEESTIRVRVQFRLE